MPAVWDDNGWDDDEDWEFSSAAADSPETLYALYDGAVARSRAARRASSRTAGSTVRCTSPRWPASRSTPGGWSATCSRSTGGTPATRTCCGRPSTAGSARTRTGMAAVSGLVTARRSSLGPMPRYRLIDTAGGEIGIVSDDRAAIDEDDLVGLPDGRELPVIEVYDDEDGQEGGVAATLVVEDERPQPAFSSAVRSRSA